jgi:hypothetical protein
MRALGLASVVAGAVGTTLLMIRAGRRQPLLLVLFALWDLAPFAALVAADAVARARRWPPRSRLTVHLVMVLVAILSLGVYSGAIPMPAGTANAAPFILVPVAAWAIIVAAVLLQRFTACPPSPLAVERETRGP